MAVTVDTPLGWFLCQDDAETANPDPNSIASGIAATHYVETPGLSRIKIRLRRTSAVSVDTECTVIAFGQDLKGDWTRLKFDPSDSAVEGDFEATFGVTSHDLDNGVFAYSVPIDLLLGDAQGFKVHILHPAGIGIDARIECNLEKPR
jgi:hypothetical protein